MPSDCPSHKKLALDSGRILFVGVPFTNHYVLVHLKSSSGATKLVLVSVTQTLALDEQVCFES